MPTSESLDFYVDAAAESGDDGCTPYDADIPYDSDIPYDGQCGGGPTGISSLADILIEIAFETDPFDTEPLWTDVTDSFRLQAEIVRGRSSELDKMETGSCIYSLDNRDRTFDPTFADGPYFGQILPRKRTRVRAAYEDGSGEVTETVFDGFISAWQPTWPNGRDSWTEITAYDLFGILALVEIPNGTSFASQTTGDRINALLDLADIPVEWRDIDDGNSTLIADTPTGNVLDAIQQAADSEGGACFVSRNNVVTFRSRSALFVPAIGNTVFGDDDFNELAYVAIQPDYSESYLYNRAVVTPKDGTPEQDDDATSQASFGIRTVTLSDVLLEQGAADDRAVGLVARFKDPQLRFPSITLNGRRDSAFWPEILANELYDRKTIKRRPPGGGDPIEQDVVIQGIHHLIVPPAEWSTDYQLFPDPASATFGLYWRLEDPVQGEIDSTYAFAP